MSIPILYAGNEGVFDGVLISVLSILRYCREPIDVYLLTMDLSDQDSRFLPLNEQQRDYLEDVCTEVNPESRVRILDVGAMYRTEMLDSPNAQTGYTPYCFLRLFADRCAELPDKVIYLDTDTVLCQSIEKLYHEDLSDNELGGVRDRYGCHFFGINYLNSGVLLLNLAKIRETQLFRKALSLCARKKVFLPDQTAINCMATRKKILPRYYNEQKNTRENTVIRHFSMTIRWIPFRTQSVKPWQVEDVREILGEHRHDEILNDYLNRKPTLSNLKQKEIYQ